MWPEAAPYLIGCLQSALSYYNIQLLAIVTKTGNSRAYIDIQDFKNCKFIDLSKSHELSSKKIIEIISNFSPDIALITMKRTGLFARAARILQKTGCLVIGANDHYWKNTWRDFANAIVAKFGIFSAYDFVLVSGVLGRLYAQRLGFKDDRIFEGVYSCNSSLFRPIGVNRFKEDQKKDWPNVFLFVGQYIPRKGLNILIEAYSQYRNNIDNPWELWCVGKGPLSKLLEDMQGITNLGYQSSEHCAQLMGKAGTFILPSIEDHWGVVIHEATCSGLPILLTHKCGSYAELVRSGYNGFTFPANDTGRLVQLMLFMSDPNRAAEMGKNSLQMSYQIDPKLWAKRILEEIPLSLRGHSLIKK
jgi:glycosyltransferase involved in cell wall biosynthesis